MKKFKLLLTLGLFTGVVTLVTSCGGGADAEAEKRRLDSLRADSIMKAEKEKAYNDSVQAVLDSMKNVTDSLAAAADAASRPRGGSGSTPSKTPTVVKIDNPKVNTTGGTTTGGAQGVKGGTTGGTPQGVKGGTDDKSGTTPKGVKGGK